MKKPAPLGVVVLVVIIALGGWYFVAKHNNSNMSMSNMGSNKSSTAARPEATDAVTIQNFAFSPTAVTVKAGTKVTWTNKDSVAHTVTETDSQTGPNSSDVNPGSSYSFTFATPGTYHYHCSIHPEMVGTVIVTE